MKKTLLLIGFTVSILPGMAQASATRDTIRGGLVGAAAGALASELSSDIRASRAIPALAGVGALTGYARHHYRHRDYYGYPASWQVTHGIYPYYRHTGYRQRYNRRYRSFQPVVVTPAPRSSQSTPTTTVVAAQSSRHPGISRIPVQIDTDRGFPLMITITKVGNQYVGPRGETYPEMPSEQTLKEKYQP